MSTHRTYNYTQRQYFEFCYNHQLQAVPGSENTLALFISYLADRIKLQSIKVYLAGIRALHISQGFPNPFTDTIATNIARNRKGTFYSNKAKVTNYV